MDETVEKNTFIFFVSLLRLSYSLILTRQFLSSFSLTLLTFIFFDFSYFLSFLDLILTIIRYVGWDEKTISCRQQGWKGGGQWWCGFVWLVILLKI